MKNQQGFTLIELVMVIVILGILAATALPKFANLQKDAKSSVMKAMEGSLKSAIAMVRAKALIDGKFTGTLTVDGMGDITLYRGYPQNLKTNMDLMLEFDTADFTIVNGSITHAKATAAANCRIKFPNAVDTSTPPAITSDLSNC